MRAANTLHNANWKESIQTVRKLRIWNSMRGVDSDQAEKICKSYEIQLKETALIVWIYMNSDWFKSLSL